MTFVQMQIRDIFSPKILSAFGFGLEDHHHGSLSPSFLFFVSGNHPVERLHFGLIQVVEPVIYTHWLSLKWNFTLVSERGISPSTTDDSKLISGLLV
jgi:hypothetical protein